MTPTLYPLLFEPSLHEKVWGGRQLQTRLSKALPSSQPYGESWEIFWKNPVANGDLRGKTLGDLIPAYPQAMLGKKDANPEYPLLIKFIDAQDWLSVQVHPGDVLAAELEGEPRGKTECWYIVDAQPGAQLVYGFSEQTDAAGFRKALESGRVKELLQYVDISPGDFIYVPAGTMHAIGPGILIYELQQTSDTTYRVYDWDRMGLDGKPRQLHVDKSMRATHFDVKPQAKVRYSELAESEGVSSATLIDGQYFWLKRTWFRQASTSRGAIMEQFKDRTSGDPMAHSISVIKGSITLRSELKAFEPMTLALGQSVFMPAQIGAYRIEAPAEAQFLTAG
jgi:mannose-6-phosphate isomerase